MNLPDTLNGATRLIAIVGDPIAQLTSPAGVAQTLIDRGRDAVVVPCHVRADDLGGFVRGASPAKNLDGLIITVPHKFDAARLCETLTEGARFLGAVNVLRRGATGGWHGDAVEGLGFVEGLRSAGCRPEGRRTLLAGAASLGRTPRRSS